MSSALLADPQLGGKLATSLAGEDNARIARLGMTPRQQLLNRYYAFYRALQYDPRTVAWDGTLHVNGIDRDAIAMGNAIPPGFYDAGQTTPLRFRKPTAPYHLGKVIVNRFTSLLFSQKRHPQLRVDGDPLTEDYVQALAEASRLWAAMIRARTLGGAQGTVVVGFKFVAGKPVIEVFDPRWVEPVFKTRGEFDLKQIEVRYQYPVEARDPATGAPVEIACWYRRVITENVDIVWRPVEVGDGDEPDWMNPDLVESYVEHGLGFCPVRWAQNLPVEGSIDGDPDCHGTFDMIEAMDALIAQADKGTIANCDPTVVLASNAKLDELRKGSDNAIKLPQGGTAQYMELTGSGPKAARELAQEYREEILEVAQCVLENPSQAGAKTATEVERTYSAMLSKADVLREQYGEQVVKPLIEMMLRAVRKVTAPIVDEVNGIVRGTIDLPDRIEKRGDKFVRLPRKLGTAGGQVTLQWPGYFDLPLSDAESAGRAAASAQQAGLIDRETAGKFIAPYFNVEDVKAVLERAQQEKEADLASGAGGFLEGMRGMGADTRPTGEQDVPDETELPAWKAAQLKATEGEKAAPTPVPAPAVVPEADEVAKTSELKLAPTDLALVVKVNEARASVGLGPLTFENGDHDPDGDLTLTEYKAKKAALVAEGAAAEQGGDASPGGVTSGGPGQPPG